MKILYDHQIFGSQRFGGISRYFFELANHLAVADDGVAACRINSPIYVNEYLRYAKPELQIKGFAMPALRRSARIYSMLNKIFRPIGSYGWRPDIVHETYYSRNGFSPLGSKVVLTVFDMIHELYPHLFSSSDRTSEFKKIAVDRADHVVCISESTQQDLVRIFGVPVEKTSVVHLGFALTGSEVVKLPSKSRPFLLYVGSRGGYKNFDRLLAAYASCNELRNEYDLVAFGGGVFNAREHTLIEGFGLNDSQVCHIGGGDSVLAALYRQAVLFVYPSLYEGFGIPPLEAMSFDCPVACSNTSSMPEVVGDAAIKFNPREVDSIASALVALSTSSERRVDLIDRGRTRLKLFSWDKCAQQTLEVYRKVLS